MSMPRFLVCVLLVSAALRWPAAGADPEPTLKQAQAAFAAADRKLNAVWAELKKVQPAGEFAKLKESQKDWLEYRDRLSYAPGYSGAPDDKREARLSQEFWSTAADLTDTRAEWLRSIAHPLVDLSPTGFWSDSYGGTIAIVEQDGRLCFAINTVRSPSAAVGSLSGTALWRAPDGLFSDHNQVPDKDDETTVAFHLEKGKLTVTGVNTSYYHGRHAYFDGEYLRVRALSPKEQVETITEAKGEGASKAQ